MLRIVIAVALAISFLLSTQALAVSVGAPMKASEIVSLVPSGTCVQGSRAFGLRLMPDGTLAPFSIPTGKVLVLTAIDWSGFAYGPGELAFFGLMIENGSFEVGLYQSYALSDPAGNAGRDAPLPSLVVKSGHRICGKNANASTGSALLQGFLTADR